MNNIFKDTFDDEKKILLIQKQKKKALIFFLLIITSFVLRIFFTFGVGVNTLLLFFWFIGFVKIISSLLMIKTLKKINQINL